MADRGRACPPTRPGVLIGSEGNMSQGKSRNQLGALRFAEGHFLQMMDANMGCYAREAFKVPVVLQMFYRNVPISQDGHVVIPVKDDDQRRALLARIIGFREHIFTRSHGLVGMIMADASFTVVTWAADPHLRN